MDVLGIIFFLVVVFFLIKLVSGRNSQSSQPQVSNKKPSRSGVPPWLTDHWARVDELGDEAIPSGYIPRWYMDDPTDRQLERLENDGVHLNGTPTKGQASDLIGLSARPEEDEMEKLRFFKQATGVKSQTHARVKLSEIFLDDENKQLWENRPATQMDKEFYKFFKMKVPKGLTHKDASALEGEYLDELEEKDEPAFNDWSHYCDMYEEISDPDYREDCDLKKIALSVFREAVDQVKSEGTAVRDMDVEDVVEKILELRPDLEKA